MTNLDPTLAAIFSIPFLLILLALKVPIFLSLAVTGSVGIMLIGSPQQALALLSQKPFWYLVSFPLLVVPLFIFMGFVAFHAGIASDAYKLARTWVSRFPGGLAIATIVACAIFGACNGSGVATSATMAALTIPEMRAAGYDRKLACGCVAAGGLLAMLIPPSIVMVIYGVITLTSVGAMLIAGIIPGILTTAVFSIGIALLLWRNPKLAPPAQATSWKEKISSLRLGWRVLVLFLVAIGSIYLGICTPSEGAALGVVVSVFMLLAKRRNIRKALKAAALDTLNTTAIILIIMFSACMYGYFLVTTGVPSELASWVTNLNLSPMTIVIITLSLYLPLGMIIDDMSCMLITVPILFPIIVGQLGFDPVWFGIVVLKMLFIGDLTPPVGIHVYVVAGVVTDVPLTDVFKGISWFVIFELFTTGILIAFPILSTWLPSMMFG